jgi:signal peptidase I
MLRKKKARRPPLFGDIAIDDDREIDIKRPEDAARQRIYHEAWLLIRDLVFAVLIATVIVVFIVQPVKVEGTSMLPRLHDGERIFVNKLIYYGLPRLERGDIVVFWYPDDPAKSYIKRIIGLPGETVEVRDGHIFINGKELNEPYIDPQLNLSMANLQSTFVKKHYYFVMGDNRDHSSDSRYWGLVPEKYIYGKALLRYWPVADLSIISHETEYDLEQNLKIQRPGNDK